MGSRGPLEGLLVLDFGQIYNGPYCGLLLGFLGARVIKIEPPQGDILRRRHPDGEPYPYLWLNSNKESLAVDLKHEDGRNVVLRLAARADIVIENFNIGVMDRLGIGWSELSRINPRLIFGAGKGFGLSGPKKDYSSMDLTIQAISGAMSATGFPGGPPVKAGPAISDFMGGVHLCVAILAAVYDRERTGRGQLVEASMQESVVMAMASAMGTHFDSLAGAPPVPPRTGNKHPGLAVAPYDVYEAADGFVAIFCVSEQHWRNLVETMDRRDLQEDSRLDTTVGRARHMQVVDDAVSEWSRRHTKQEIADILVAAGVPFAPVQTVAEVAEDPHLLARGMWQDVPHPTRGQLRLPCAPVRLHGTPERRIERIAPELGSDTDAVLREIAGMDDAEIKVLRDSGAIGAEGRS